MMPVSKSSSPTDLKAGGISEQEKSSQDSEGKEKEESQEERKRLQHKILKGKEKPLKSAYGINYVLRKIGRDRPAIVTFKEEKLIIINLDHDLIKNLHGLRPLQKNMILCTLLARGHFHILESFRNIVSYEEYVDNMVSTAISKITE